MPSGFNANSTPGRVVFDAGVLSSVVGGARIPIGVSKGGVSFDPGMETRQAEYDGRRVMIAGLDRVTEYDARFEGTIIELSDALLTALMPGSTTAGTTTTPLPASRTITPAMHLVLPRMTILRGDGQYVSWEFDLGLVTEWDVDTSDKEEAEISVTIGARVDPTAPGFATHKTDTPPYRMIVEATNPIAA